MATESYDQRNKRLKAAKKKKKDNYKAAKNYVKKTAGISKRLGSVIAAGVRRGNEERATTRKKKSGPRSNPTVKESSTRARVNSQKRIDAWLKLGHKYSK